MSITIQNQFSFKLYQIWHQKSESSNVLRMEKKKQQEKKGKLHKCFFFFFKEMEISSLSVREPLWRGPKTQFMPW